MKRKHKKLSRVIIPKGVVRRGKIKSDPKAQNRLRWKWLQKEEYEPIPVGAFTNPLNVGGGKERTKIAFIFLTMESLHHGPLWHKYLSIAGDRCNVYAHSKFPEYVKQNFLRDRIIKSTVETRWAHISLVHATNRLIMEALRDSTNSYIMLVSEKCVPIRPFGEFYDYVTGHDKSSIFWYKWGHSPNENTHRWRTYQKGESKYPRSMYLNISLQHWTKQSQWMLLRRDHAAYIAHNNYTPLFQGMPAPDEHYYINVLKAKWKNFDMENINYPLTHVNWKDSGVNNHPVSYTGTVDVKKLLKLDSSTLFKNDTRKFVNRDIGESFFARKVEHTAKFKNLKL